MSKEHDPFIATSAPTNVAEPGQNEVSVISDSEAETKKEKPRNKWKLPAIQVAGVAAVIIAVVVIFYLTATTDKSKSQGKDILVYFHEDNLLQGYADIDTPQGKLRGYARISREGRKFVAFYKVPYARPPLGSLRFKDPEPALNWTGIRDEFKLAPQCLQKEKYPTPPGAVYTSGEEDCLYANIYVPSTASRSFPVNSTVESINSKGAPVPTKFPVMMYIHGGGGNSGNGSRYGAEYFMDQEVILITFNFRLPPLGSLNTGDNVIRGNMGFKDMVQLLKWIRSNIVYYGGDPERITIFGNSAGAIYVSYLMLSPLTEGLISGAISQSGGTLCGNILSMVEAHPEKKIKEVSNALNCTNTTSAELLKCLQTKSASDIVLGLPGTRELLTVENRENPLEGTIFMPDTPYNLLKAGKLHPVPHIFGNTNAEWIGWALLVLQNETLIELLNTDFVTHAKEIIYDEYMSPEDLKNLRQFYFGNKTVGNETMLEMIQLISDSAFDHCCYASAIMHAISGKSYLYWLSKAPAKSYALKYLPEFPAEEMGLVSHGDELQFLFPYNGFPEITVADKNYNFSTSLVDLWAKFAAEHEFGNLGAEGRWRSIDAEKAESTMWLELNDKPTLTNSVLTRMQFWDRFTPEQLMYV